MASVRNKMDLTHGPILKNLLIFAIPIVLTNLLQQLYHAADMIVVGNFARDPVNAQAAVGATTSVTSLCLNLFIGLAVGANVICARLFGAKKQEELRRAMHTSILLALLCGVGIGLLGAIFSRTLLVWTGAPEGVLNQATLYMQIIFLGQPGSLVYNFGAGILRSHGDTKRPMYILTVAGLVNVVLNLFFVIVFKMDAAGVALATVISQYLSAIAVLWILFSPRGDFHLRFSELSLGKAVRPIAGVGIPSGLNSMVFSLSNVIIVMALNEMGDIVLAGNSAAHNVDAMLYQVLVAFYTACVSFAGQNYGAKRYDRIEKLWKCAITVSFITFAVIGAVLFFFAKEVMYLFNPDPEVIRLGAIRVQILAATYAVYVFPEISIGCIRGMGKSVLTSALNVICICTPRIFWVLFVFGNLKNGIAAHDFQILLWCYPISWTMSGIAQIICYRYYLKKAKKQSA